MVVDTSGNTDWANVNGGATAIPDKPSGNTDDVFVGGSAENDTTVSIDPTHSSPGKDDILRAYVASENVGGNTFLYLAWIRSVTNGDAHVDFELNQNQTSDWSVNPLPATIHLNRTAGDLLISYDFLKGGSAPVITSYTWNGSAWDHKTNLTSLGFAEGQVSTSNFNDPLNGNAGVSAGQFGEAAINLDDVPGTNFTPNTCESFGSVFVKSRSSGASDTNELKDFIQPVPIHVSNCGSVTIHKDVPGTDPQSFTFSASGPDQSVGGFSLADDGTAGDNTKSFPAIQPGAYSFDETNMPATWKLDNPAVTCTASGSGTSAPSSQTTSALSVTLGANGSIDCTYHDTPKTGTIEVK
jgi:hypothetical protein